MSEEYIKCCPFCGNNKVEIARTNKDACWVCCSAESGCGAEASSHKTREGAIEIWNKRVTVITPTVIVDDMDKDYPVDTASAV